MGPVVCGCGSPNWLCLGREELGRDVNGVVRRFMKDDGWQFWLLNRPWMGNDQAEQPRGSAGAQTRGALALLLEGHRCHCCHWWAHPGANLHSRLNPRVVTKDSRINNLNNCNLDVSELLLDATILVLLHMLESHQSCVLFLHASPAVNLNVGPCDESCLITCEIAAGVRNICRRGWSPKGDGSYKRLAILRRVGFA